MEIRLLGPVEIRVGDRRLEVGPPQRRAVLAALAVDAGRPVSWPTLIDRVWGDRLPTQVRSAVHANVTMIRRLLAEANGAAGTPAGLIRRGGGYLLDLDPERVDLHRFRRLAAAARRSDVPDAQRSGLLAEALGRWDGQALAGLPGDWPDRMRQTWELERLDAAVDWARAELRLGRHAQVIGPVRALVADYPFAEPLVAVLMRALAATGRDAEALDCYAAARARLSEHLGAEPGPELRAVHDAVLRACAGPPVTSPQPVAPPRPVSDPPPARAPAHARARARAPAPAPARTVPAMLPPDTDDFTGRADELADLDTLLAAAAATPEARKPPEAHKLPESAGVRGAVLSGPAGVGKTALSVRWAHRVTDEFPGGQLYADLGSALASGPAPAAEVLAAFLTALGVADRDILGRLDQRAARYRAELRGRRVLVVLDDAGSVDQVRPLLPADGSCRVLVTSRAPLPGLAAEGVRARELDVLPAADAASLLGTLLGARAEGEPAAASALAAACARLPLALRVAAGATAARPRLALPDIVSDLARQRHRPGRSGNSPDPETAAREVLAWSYRQLPAGQARAFRLLGLHQGPHLDAGVTAALAGTGLDRASRLLDRLAAAALVQPAGAGRYGMHDLVRDYAAERAAAEDGEQDRRAALGRVLDYYLAAATAALDALATLGEPGPDSVVRPSSVTAAVDLASADDSTAEATGCDLASAAVPTLPADLRPPGADPAAALAWLGTERPRLAADTATAVPSLPAGLRPPDADPAAALAWLGAERPALLAAAAQAAGCGRPDYTVGLVSALVRFLDSIALLERVGVEDEPVEDEPAERGHAAGLAAALVWSMLIDLRDVAEGIQEALLDAETARRRDGDLAREHSRQWRLARVELGELARRAFDGGASTQPPRRWDGNPYRGLWPFTEQSADVFYGRERATVDLVGKLAERLDAPAVVVVTGASGVGKSSLLRAGLLPALRRGLLGVPGSAGWPWLVMTAAGEPLADLAARLAALAGMDRPAVHRELLDRPRQAHLLVRRAVLAHLTRAAAVDEPAGDAQGRLVLVVDQFEQVFTHPAGIDGTDAAPFIAALVAAARTPCGPAGKPAAVVVLVVRADYWDRCAARPELAGLLQYGQFVVAPMAEPDLRRAITGPAAAAGLQVEPGLTDAVLADLRARPSGGYDAGGLLSLSQALFATCRDRDGDRLTRLGYRRGGGVAGAVAASAEATYGRLSPAGKVVAAQIFQHLTVLTADGAPARRRASVPDLHGDITAGTRQDAAAVVAAFTGSRLLVCDDDRVQIAHDVLFDAWPRLRQWLRETRADRILPGNRAAHSRRGRSLAGAAAILLLVALTGGSLQQRHAAVVRGRIATFQAERATAWGLITRAESLRDTDIRTALQLRIAAETISPAEEVGSSLFTMLDQSHLVATLTGPAIGPSRIVFSPDGGTLATAGKDGVWLWDVRDLRRPVPLSASPVLGEHQVYDVAFSPDGGTLVTVSDDAVARWWDVRHLSQPFTEVELRGRGHPVYDAAFGPDRRTLAAANADGAWLWDLSNRRHPSLLSHTDRSATYVVTFSLDNRALATAGTAGIRLWNIADPRHPWRVPIPAGPPSTATGLALSPAGQWLAVTSADGVQLLDLRRGLKTTIQGQNGSSAAFNSRDSMLLTAGDRNAALWDILLDPQHRAPLITLAGHTATVSAVAISPDGKILATASDDHTVVLWTANPSSGVTLPVGPDQILALACTAAGGGLTRQQWGTYLPDLPYRQTC